MASADTDLVVEAVNRADEVRVGPRERRATRTARCTRSAGSRTTDERRGFRAVGRVGGSDTMLLDLR